MNRRNLLHRTAAAALFGLAPSLKAAKALPDSSLLDTNAEEYWKRIREEQFLLPDWRAFLNNGSLGVAPRPVLDAVTDYLSRGAGLLMDEYPRWGYETLDEERATLSAFLGCKKDELAITHNATEGLSMISAGLDLKAGDEVVMTDQEHPSGKAGWHRRAQRDGIVVREVPIPHPPKSWDQLAEIMVSAIGPKTKVLFFSGILSPTGVIMPVRQICDAARAKGVICVVDGAHMNGQIALNLSEFNCDYYAGSPHKWMFAPAGCGILYIREENLDRLWPTIVTGGWDDKALKAARFMKVGTNNKAIMVGMMAGLQFMKSIGPERIYNRIHSLAKLNYSMAKSRPWLEILSSEDDRLYGSLVTISFRGANAKPLWELAAKRKIWIYGSERLRISTHIHTRPKDLEAFYATMDEALGHKAA
ncbi:MAG: aminotransferase class V-fold PLP-dependent enzyme [Bryobacterales bacterium]|nr:aminotransferase class V-fold PLP-dependent enzyme [Bryobacterales bacterium]